MKHDIFDTAVIEEFKSCQPRIELIGNRRLLIENHKGIMEYDDTMLRIKCDGCELHVIGDELALTALSMDELAVSGTIVSVAFVSA